MKSWREFWDDHFCRKSSKQIGKPEKKAVRQKWGIEKSGCCWKILGDDSSWNSSLFCIRRIRSWYCHHLHMNEEAIQNSEKNWMQTYIVFVQILSPPLQQKQMNPVTQNVAYLKHVALERRPIGIVPSSEILSQGGMASGFSSRWMKLWKIPEFLIPRPQWKEMHLSKHERNLEENCENIIFVGN